MKLLNVDRMIRSILSIVAAALAISSCTFKQDLQFNKDFSGIMNCELDMSSLSSMNVDEETGLAASIVDDEMLEKLEKLKGIEGISLVKMEETTPGLILLSYHFKDLVSLNKSGFLFYESPTGVPFEYFKLKNKKTLVFSMPDMSAEEQEGEEEMGMGSMFTFSLKMSFAKNVKKLKTEGEGILSNSKKEITLDSDMDKLSKKDYKSEMTISF
jgi:hypothetical protein